MYPEAGPPEPGPGESSVRPDPSDHGSWPGQGGPGPTSAELVNKIKRTSVGSGGEMKLSYCVVVVLLCCSVSCMYGILLKVVIVASPYMIHYMVPC